MLGIAMNGVNLQICQCHQETLFMNYQVSMMLAIAILLAVHGLWQETVI